MFESFVFELYYRSYTHLHMISKNPFFSFDSIWSCCISIGFVNVSLPKFKYLSLLSMNQFICNVFLGCLYHFVSLNKLS